MTMPTRTRLIFAAAILLLAAVIGGVALTQRGTGSGSGEALVGGPFRLTNHLGQTVTEADFRGKYMLVFFGFTFCPDICPTELQVMTHALETMGASGARITPVFVTIDPERDTPDVMKAYVENFGPNLVGLTGTPEEIAAVAKAYRVYYKKSGRFRRLSHGPFQHHLSDGPGRALREALHLHHRRRGPCGRIDPGDGGYPLKT